MNLQNVAIALSWDKSIPANATYIATPCAQTPLTATQLLSPVLLPLIPATSIRVAPSTHISRDHSDLPMLLRIALFQGLPRLLSQKWNCRLRRHQVRDMESRTKMIVEWCINRLNSILDSVLFPVMENVLMHAITV